MAPTDTPRHSVLDDVQGILTGTTLCAFGLLMLQHMGLVTGQTAGLALVLSYMTEWSFGAVFFVINLPFYWLAIRRMGWRFTLKTLMAVGLLSLLVEVLPRHISFNVLTPPIGAVLVGLITGAGLLALFRHGASLGGIGVLAVYLQDKTGFRAGWTQLLVDAVVFCLALMVLDLDAIGYSVLGAVVLNLLIAINHRRDHYVAL